MIDFRYHVVSLISVFLALAVGIALGAGPLKESIGTQLTGQVDQLRKEKADLRGELDEAREEANLQRAFAAATSDDLLNDVLEERSVAIVTLPDVEKDHVEGVIETVEQAGGTIAARFELHDLWFDPTQRASRSSMSSSIYEYLDPQPSEGASVEAQLGEALGQMLTARSSSKPEEVSERAEILQELLVTADYLSATAAQTEPADLVVFLTGGALSIEEDDDLVSSNTAIADIAMALTNTAEGVVVTAEAPEADDSVNLLRNEHSGTVTTIDGEEFLTGQITAVLALAESVVEPGNAYGSRTDAEEVAPERVSLPEPSDDVDSSSEDDEEDGSEAD